MPTKTRVTEVRRGDLVLDVHDAGPLVDEVVVLLHGWPTGSACWSDVTEALVARGRRVVALDQRGYSPRARPPGRSPYRMSELVGDVHALLDALDARTVHLVGHDWGGAVAWAVADAHPDRLATLTVLSTPHPRALARSLTRSAQLVRSAYVGLFQLPVIPERILLAREGAVLRRVLEESGLAPDRADTYVDAMREPGALSASLAWYRAVPLEPPRGGDPITVPTLYVWSDGDGALDRCAADLTADHVSAPYRFEVLEGVSHWIPEERPSTVVDLLLDHARGPMRQRV
jgi:pimeloyl-ACP methyl ester carboxylesterase